MPDRGISAKRFAGPHRFAEERAPFSSLPAHMAGFALAAALIFGEAASAFTAAPPAPARDPLIVPVAEVTFSVERIDAQSGETVPVKVVLPTDTELARANAEEGSFILIRNIPAGISMSLGMPTGKVWVIPAKQAAGLRMLSTTDTVGTFELEFNLIGPGNRVLAQRPVLVRIYPPEIRGTVGALPTNAPPEPSAALSPAPAPVTERLAPEEESVLLRRGEEVLRQGGIAAARLLFEELAIRGSGKGALALARTYDPALAPSSATSALSPNMDEAIKWYELAAELGMAEAQQRRAEIASGR